MVNTFFSNRWLARSRARRHDAAGRPSPWAEAGAGGTSTTHQQVTAAAAAADGSYPFSAGATNAAEPAFAGSAPGTYVVLSSLAVTASTDRASYSGNQVVSMSALVTGNGSPVAGAAVVFTVRRANGRETALNAVTSANGFATASLRLNKRNDPPGTYRMTADARLASGITGSAETSFTVR